MTGIVFWVLWSLQGVWCECRVEEDLDAAILLDKLGLNYGDRFFRPHLSSPSQGEERVEMDLKHLIKNLPLMVQERERG